MYANKIISDLIGYKDVSSKYRLNEFGIKHQQLINNALNLIPNSHKVHMGDYGKILDLLNLNGIKFSPKEFFENNCDFFKLPHNPLFLTAEISYEDGTRGISAILLMKNDNGIHQFNFKRMGMEPIHDKDVIFIYPFGVDFESGGHFCQFPGFFWFDLKDRTIGGNYLDRDFQDMGDQERENYRIVTLHSIPMAMFCLILLNCKNIQYQKIHPPLKLNRKRLKKNKLPLYSYHILKFRAIEDFLYKSKTDNKSGYHNRIHFCRGHFKKYTEENPLFGKYTGYFWWEPFLRGKNKSGFVDKDYALRH